MCAVRISTGRVSSCEPWHILEVSIGQAPDVMALRISKELQRLHQSAEILIPMQRNANGDAEWIVEHIYVRGLNGSLRKLAETPGIDFIRKELAPPHWIQTLLRQGQGSKFSRPKKGDFVRVLAGPCARLCGHITLVRAERLTVSILMRTKTVLVHTESENVQLVECPPEHRSFFYSAELA